MENDLKETTEELTEQVEQENQPDETTEEKETQGEETKKKQEEKKYSDEEVNAIIARKLKKLKDKQEEEANEAKKLAKMNAEEKASYKIQKLEEKIKEYEQKETLSEMKATAREILADSEIHASDSLISHLITTDAEETKKAVESFIALFEQCVEEKVKERLKGKTPKGGNTAKLTKEQIFAIKDTAERQRLIAENADLFI